MRAATDRGLDTVIETAGSIKPMELAQAITARGGRTVSAGLPASDARHSHLHAQMVSDEKSILGSHMGRCVPERDIPRLPRIHHRGKLPVGRLRSGFLPLADINAAFDRLAEGDVLRQILRPNG